LQTAFCITKTRLGALTRGQAQHLLCQLLVQKVASVRALALNHTQVLEFNRTREVLGIYRWDLHKDDERGNKVTMNGGLLGWDTFHSLRRSFMMAS
jgi:hypothetical protein